MTDSLQPLKRQRAAGAETKQSSSATGSSSGSNSLQLVKCRVLPQCSELSILECLGFTDLCQLLFLSRDVHALCVAYFKSMRAVDFVMEPPAEAKTAAAARTMGFATLAAWKMLRHCQQLRSVRLQAEPAWCDFKQQLRQHIADIVGRNASSLERFDAPRFLMWRAVFTGLATCTRLQRWTEVGVCDLDSAQEHGADLRAVFASNQDIVVADFASLARPDAAAMSQVLASAAGLQHLILGHPEPDELRALPRCTQMQALELRFVIPVDIDLLFADLAACLPDMLALRSLRFQLEQQHQQDPTRTDLVWRFAPSLTELDFEDACIDECPRIVARSLRKLHAPLSDAQLCAVLADSGHSLTSLKMLNTWIDPQPMSERAAELLLLCRALQRVHLSQFWVSPQWVDAFAHSAAAKSLTRVDLRLSDDAPAELVPRLLLAMPLLRECTVDGMLDVKGESKAQSSHALAQRLQSELVHEHLQQLTAMTVDASICLLRLPRLRDLEFQDEIDPAVLQDMRWCPNVEELWIRSPGEITDECVVSAVTQLKRLRILWVEYCSKVTARVLPGLAAAVPKSLTSLSIGRGRYELGDVHWPVVDARALASLVQNAPLLTKLSLSVEVDVIAALRLQFPTRGLVDHAVD